ncbi:MAG: hypothetical protein KKB34_09995 [Bacteroidetes bacterium]|nr:hypothetical protein [Bacteroidota bacterium]
MITFKYSIFAKMIYRYANIPATIILVIHLISSLFMMSESIYFIFPLVINLIVLILLNKFYLKSYSRFPFKIEVDNEKMICSDYFMSKKEVIVSHSDIKKIYGGMFSGNSARPLYIVDGKNNEIVGIHTHIKNFNKLLTITLSNIDQQLYQGLLKKMTDMGAEHKQKRKRKKDKKKSG